MFINWAFCLKKIFTANNMFYSLRFVLPEWRIAGSKKFNRKGGQGMPPTRDQSISCNEGISDDQEWSSETFLVKSDSSRKPRTKKRQTLFQRWSPLKCFVSWCLAKPRENSNRTLQISCLVLVTYQEYADSQCRGN